MRTLSMTLALIAAAAAGVGAVPAQAKEKMTQEEALAKALEGREAGTPVNCITQRDIRSSRIFDKVGILYEMRDGTYYLNRPVSGASSLDWTDVLVTDTHSNQLCSVDIVKLYDSATQMQTGYLGLDTFVPYPKPKREKDK